MKRIFFYSYDSIDNPWCGGGGAYRDWQVLLHQRNKWDSITIIVGNYLGFKPGTINGIHIRSLGFKTSHLISRISYCILANFHLLFNRRHVVGNAVSIHAPLFLGLFFISKYYIVVHHLVEKQSFSKFGVIGWIPYLSEKAIFKAIKHVISSNRAVAEKIRHMNPRANVLVSANGYDPGLLQLSHVQPEIPFVLFLGRFDIYMKGLDILLPAFKKYKENLNQDIKLILAGKGSDKKQDEIKTLIKREGLEKEIILMPNITEEKKQELLQSCFFFCSPSRFEGWGIAALEANASGKAVIVTETQGFADSIKKDFSGIFISPNDLEGLVEALLRLTRDNELRERLGDNGRKWAAQFSWPSISQKEYEWINLNLL